MAIVRFEPFRDLLTSQREYVRLLKEAFSPMSGETEVSTRAWAPPVDIYETEDAIVLKAELPGIDPKDVEVRVEDNTLYLKGERNYEKGSMSRTTTALSGRMDPLLGASRSPIRSAPRK